MVRHKCTKFHEITVATNYILSVVQFLISIGRQVSQRLFSTRNEIYLAIGEIILLAKNGRCGCEIERAKSF